MKSKWTWFWVGALVCYLIGLGVFFNRHRVDGTINTRPVTHHWFKRFGSAGIWGFVEDKPLRSDASPSPYAPSTFIFAGPCKYHFPMSLWQVLAIVATPIAAVGFFVLRSITRRLRRGHSSRS